MQKQCPHRQLKTLAENLKLQKLPLDQWGAEPFVGQNAARVRDLVKPRHDEDPDNHQTGCVPQTSAVVQPCVLARLEAAL